jgi:hypothetical protein
VAAPAGRRRAVVVLVARRPDPMEARMAATMWTVMLAVPPRLRRSGPPVEAVPPA